MPAAALARRVHEVPHRPGTGCLSARRRNLVQVAAVPVHHLRGLILRQNQLTGGPFHLCTVERCPLPVVVGPSPAIRRA